MNSKYNKEFLKDFKFSNQNNKYVPTMHIQPKSGLLNDPNCVFHYEGETYCFFQHHPPKPLHHLKTMSLAVSANLLDFEYHYMVNRPEHEFENAGVYSGNALVANGRNFMFYTGNHRNLFNEKTSWIVRAEYNTKTKKVVNKKQLFSNKDFKEKYTDHFRDPFLFFYNDKSYLLIGAQGRDLSGKIALVEIDLSTNNFKFIKEFVIDVSTCYMVECPSIFFENNYFCLAFCIQKNMDSNKKADDYAVYSILTEENFFRERTTVLSSLNLLDYGPSYYAPQFFKIKNDNYLIAWAGKPKDELLPEAKFNWIHCLTMFKKVSLKNNFLIQKEVEQFKSRMTEKKSNHLFWEKLSLTNDEIISVFTDEILAFEILLNQNNAVIFDYTKDEKIETLITLNNLEAANEVEIFVDNSIIEIKISKNYWFTSRVYFNAEMKIKKDFKNG